MLRGNRGFTLIELMVTMAVLAIVAMIAAPNLSTAIEKRKLETSTTDLEKALAQARSDAVLNRKETTIHLNTTGVDTPTERYWSIPRGVELSFKAGVCDKKTWTVSNVSSFNSIVFLAQGNIANLPTNLEIQIKNDAEYRFIYLTNFGRVTSSSKSTFVGACE